MKRLAFAATALIAFAGLLALGTWQLERRSWKLDLIARVDARVHAAPVEAPVGAGPTTKDDEYRRVRATGHFLHDRETLVQAVTALGSGFWVITPLQRADGQVVLVNRGFVPPEAREPAARGATAAQGEAVVVGLLRLTEPGGGFLRTNEPAAGRWFSRDVQAIAAARGIQRPAAYFIDLEAEAEAEAEAGSGKAAAPRTWPAAGLTVISFTNNHLVYALTWYALALMVAAGAAYAARHNGRAR